MLLGIDVMLLLVAAAGSKRGGGGIEACEGSDGDLITEALTDDATAGSPTCSGKNNVKYFIFLITCAQIFSQSYRKQRWKNTYITAFMVLPMQIFPL